MRASIGRRGLRLPEGDPATVNYCALNGTLAEDPGPGRSPLGDPVTLLRLEFPVAHPEHPRVLWTWASCEIEVPQQIAEEQDVRALRGGTPVLAAGRLSERWVVERGRSYRRAALLATLLHAEPPTNPGTHRG